MLENADVYTHHNSNSQSCSVHLGLIRLAIQKIVEATEWARKEEMAWRGNLAWNFSKD